MLHRVLVGVDAFNYELDQVQTRFRPTLANAYAVDVQNPVYGQTRTPGPFTNTLEKQNGVGIYTQDQIDLSEQWKLLVGLRYDRFEQDIANRIASTSQGQDKTASSPRIGVVYQVTPTASAYASCSKGFRPNSGQSAAWRGVRARDQRKLRGRRQAADRRARPEHHGGAVPREEVQHPHR